MSIIDLISFNIRQIRKRKGITQEQLSNATGIPLNHVQKIESRTPPDIKVSTLGRIAKALDVDPRELIQSNKFKPL